MNAIARTRKSHSWNEDRFIIGNSFYMVIDGATPLIKHKEINLTRWMVTYIKKHINRYKGPIKERLDKLAIDIYNDLNLDTIDPAYLPSAGIAYLEEDEEYYYASILGDCEITFRMNNGEILRCFSDELSNLDSQSVKELVDAANEHHLHTIDAMPYIQGTLIKHRKLINKPGGYSVFTILPNSDFEAKVFRIKKEQVLDYDVWLYEY